MVSVTLGPWTFDHAEYDAEADVLYLSLGEPRRAAGEESPEGHVWRFDAETGDFCGITLIGIAKQIHEGTVTITVPMPPSSEPVEIATGQLEELVCA